jgi:hypothetical protein
MGDKICTIYHEGRQEVGEKSQKTTSASPHPCPRRAEQAAELLVEQGHNAVLHACNEQSGCEAMTAVPGAETVVIGDLSSVAHMKEVAAK